MTPTLARPPTPCCLLREGRLEGRLLCSEGFCGYRGRRSSPGGDGDDDDDYYYQNQDQDYEDVDPVDADIDDVLQVEGEVLHPDQGLPAGKVIQLSFNLDHNTLYKAKESSLVPV